MNIENRVCVCSSVEHIRFVCVFVYVNDSDLVREVQDLNICQKILF